MPSDSAASTSILGIPATAAVVTAPNLACGGQETTGSRAAISGEATPRPADLQPALPLTTHSGEASQDLQAAMCGLDKNT